MRITSALSWRCLAHLGQTVRLVSVALFLPLFCVSHFHAQTAVQDPTAAQQTKKAVQDAASTGTPLSTTSNVDSSVNIEAVMLPSSIVSRVFGTEVSKKYAVIEINISNRNNDAGFILQSLFIDYSRWALAQPLSIGGISRNGKSFQSKASTQEVSSVEYRIVRGQMLDQQPWTKRNLALRSITILGSIGTSFAFPFSRDVVTGIGAWNGAVVPGFAALFPDGMEGQMNRVSDYGFRNNKVIPQQSADIVVAFFPIERFLSPSLKQIFLDTPALFFNPFLMAIDPKTQKSLHPILKNALGDDNEVKTQIASLTNEIASLNVEAIAEAQESFQQRQDAFYRDSALQTDLLAKSGTNLKGSEAASVQKALEEVTNKVNDDAKRLEDARKTRDDLYKPLKANKLFNFLSQISLSNINIVVSGVMTVDQVTVPASIESTCFDKAGPDLWAISGKKTCFIKGRFLNAGTPQILGVDPADPGILNIVVDKDNSTSDLLKFTFDLKQPLNSATIDILVTKQGKDGTSTNSMKYRVSSAYTLPTPVIETVTTDASGVATITGSGFYSNPGNPFSLLLRQPSADKKTDKQISTVAPADASKITLDAVTLGKAAAGCYQVVVMVGTSEADSPAHQLARIDPSITSAKKDGTKVAISGSNLDAISECNANLTVEFLDGNDKIIGSAKKFTDGSLQNNTITFDLGGDAANATNVRLTGRTAVVIN
jgi:hypothetical protein